MSSPSTTLGKYQIIREIARSNDIVYEAYDPLMNRRVALKELAMPPGSTSQQREERIRRFLREAKAAGSLSHPNIMTVYEVGQEGDRHFIAMEFLDGHTLRNELDTHGSLAPNRAIDIAIEVCEALEFSHKSGVVHRDIKPDNIQLLSDGRIKLTDFGIARLTFEPNITMDGQVFGTPSYMSPEQVVGKEIDARSDIFSLGVVLYEMVAGQKPFTGDSVVSITYAIMNKDPDQPTGVNYQLWQMLAKALDKSPALRYSSAHEMLVDLQAAKAGSASLVLDQPAPAPTHAFAPPTGNPYLNPFMPPVAPPPSYLYNPYQPSPVGTQMPGTGHTTAPPGYMLPLPNYYPPPPRQPLIRPETSRFLGRLFVVALLFGALISLLIVGIWSAGNVYERMQNKTHDQTIQAQLAGISKSIPLSDRIERFRSLMSQLRDPATIGQANRDLAALYKEHADELLRNGDVDGAENSLRVAISVDGMNPDWYEALGDFYSKVAGRAPDSLSQRDRYRGAADQYDQALTRQYGEAASNRLSNKLAEAAYRAAAISWRQADSEGYRLDIERAEERAKDPALIGKIDALRTQAEGG